MMRKGFTLIEVLVVVAMVVGIATVVAPVLTDALSRGDARAFAMEAVDALREAQSSTMSGRENARYGVHFESSKLVFFQGASYAEADPNNLTHAFSGRATVTAVTRTPSCTLVPAPGDCDVHFARVKGQPTETASIVFTDATGQTRTVTVNEVGLIEWN